MWDRLDDFVFRTDTGLLNFPIALLAGLVVAFLTIGYTTLKPARANPVRATQYESSRRGPTRERRAKPNGEIGSGQRAVL
jgi:hypothetical protein